MHYSMDLLQHLRAVRECAGRLGFAMRVDAGNLALDIKKGDLEVRFQPRFLYYDEEKRTRNYTYYFQPDVTGFVGWLPYFNKVWPIALDKLAFKAFCRERGLPTPDWWTAPAAGIADFLVKTKGGSFGVGMRGPFRRPDRANPYHQLGEGEYCERFVEGKIVKAWYWNAGLVCLEMRPFPRLRGDGVRTIRELLEERLADSLSNVRWPQFEAVVTYQGKTMTSVLKAKESIFAGFRYGSLLDPWDPENRNVLAEHKDSRLADGLRSFGATLHQAIPENLKPGVLFTLDAVVDSGDKMWLLEMNPNPTVHPDVYPELLRSVLAREVSGMPSLAGSKGPALPAMTGGLVWASSKQSGARAREAG
jgi:hypothetical protein